MLAAALAGGSLVLLAGCSVDGMLWGPEGARVIDVTEQLIDAAPSDAQDSFACDDDRATSVDRPSLDATWRINLEGAGMDGASGGSVPTDVFYREEESGLCVADVIWQTVDGGS
ncbi:MAG: hypothetical protein K0Q52_3071 [Microbacterium sp.]|nr:hypothetical protein [Microbacterium sp.]